MSDFINSLGARGPSAYGIGAPRTSGAAGPTGMSGEAQAPPEISSEGFSPTAEAGESKQDAQAGEARASQIFAAWGPSAPTPTANAGQLSIQGAENTSVNQVHGVKNGEHVGSQGPEAGFSGGTVFSSRPPG